MKSTYTTPETLSERDAAWFEELTVTLARGRSALLGLQHEDGHWAGTVETNERLEAELVLLLAFLGKLHNHRAAPAARSILSTQQADGTWGDLGASVRAYFALKLAGHAAATPHMTRAAEAIRARGGAAAADPLTRVWLALLGQLPHSACARTPVQTVLLPKWLGGIDSYPEWERAQRVALGIAQVHEPVVPLAEAVGISELFVRPAPAHKPNRPRPFRGRAVRAATNWLRARYSEDGPDSNFRVLAFTAVALKSIGVPADDAEMHWVLTQLESLCTIEGGALTVRPFRAPVRDTALALLALAGTEPSRPSAARDSIAEWLLERGSRPAPRRDTETAALVLTALARGGHVRNATASAVVYRSLNELLALQNRDGGWAAFDRGVSGDPSCPAVTACVLEAIGHFGFRVGQRPVDAAVQFILDRQEVAGQWHTRCGAGAIQTTWRVFAGLHAVGFDVYDLPIRRAVRWLKESQNADASWGSATETAWAVLALLAAGEGESEETRAGAEFIAGTQRADGTWPENGFPCTAFASGVELRSGIDAVCAPLLALGRYATDRGQPVEVRKTTVRRDAGHTLAGPKSTRHTLAEM
ncbi:Squalene--hopene cyclase [Gemmata obscuriglobus]|uniref:prenyltransferase/squalene oxidase repeat-containing protein n=1 Tax=Gemmata obscuriglobus TaxID=114 RepID=UPI0011CD0906|nr:prenyltransferase/squalene oxidase repeat-containing protein [Gemmata obscuriglobus]QEG29693.1 Squalene--hopene cyclase [Gemmata obscuriglobus]VTS09010.1 Squalene-hopene cyclase OS=Singulisphaera acidiphila (strain ATCC BAA-1392 / DSM 18658 / VKM B-2454 / MOB10) GN=Sinac_2971 PE=4 SV=1: Prenyltrans_1: Prenyltrans_2 [Gemmata obscuriglobus UQM 2246]